MKYARHTIRQRSNKRPRWPQSSSGCTAAQISSAARLRQRPEPTLLHKYKFLRGHDVVPFAGPQAARQAAEKQAAEAAAELERMQHSAAEAERAAAAELNAVAKRTADEALKAQVSPANIQALSRCCMAEARFFKKAHCAVSTSGSMRRGVLLKLLISIGADQVLQSIVSKPFRRHTRQRLRS